VFNLLWGNIGVDGIVRVTAEKNYRKLVVKLNPKQANILKYFTPLSSLYQNNFSNRTEVENELMEQFPRIANLINYEIKYLEIREKTRPQKYDLIQQQFKEFGINPELVIEDEETKMDVEAHTQPKKLKTIEFIVMVGFHHKVGS
jgi:DNA-binding protein H-NS